MTEQINLTINNSSGEKYTVPVTRESTIHDIKVRVEEKTGMPVSQIQFLANGVMLNDDDTVESANLHANQEITMVIELQGGSF